MSKIIEIIPNCLCRTAIGYLGNREAKCMCGKHLIPAHSKVIIYRIKGTNCYRQFDCYKFPNFDKFRCNKQQNSEVCSERFVNSIITFFYKKGYERYDRDFFCLNKLGLLIEGKVKFFPESGYSISHFVSNGFKCDRVIKVQIPSEKITEYPKDFKEFKILTDKYFKQ